MNAFSEAIRISAIAYPSIFVVNAVFWLLIVVLVKAFPVKEEQ